MSGITGVMAVDCVVFDIGNVLIRWDPRNLYRRMGYADATTMSILEETGLLRINHRVLDAGGPFAATVENLAGRFPQHREFIGAFHTRWAELLDGAIGPNVEIMQRLKRSGLPTHAISNYSREKFDITRTLFPFLDEFDELVLSGDVGLVKPDAEIFELLVRRRSLNPARTVFIDDSAANVATAQQLGFTTIHFNEATTDLGAELVRLGLSTETISGRLG